MAHSFKLTTAFCSSLAVMVLLGCAKSETAIAKDLSKSDIEKIVREYILDNPEIIGQALILGEEREKARALQAISKELRHDSRDFSIGPKNAKVTIVEFFDYNCSYCKRSTDWLQTTIKKYPKDVRIVFKELPILDNRTKTSRNASKAALAAGKQGKYSEMHFALMDGMVLSEKFINDTAQKMGLNVAKFKAEMKSDDINTHIEDTIELASKVPELTGTPFFIINDDYVAGGNTPLLDEKIKAALSN